MTAITGINSGLSYNFIPTGAMSAYMEDGTLFNNYAMCGNGYGFGLANPTVFNNMSIASDNMTSLAFKQRSNQHVLGSFNEIMQKNLTEMASALRAGEGAKAAMLYEEIYQAISKNYGEEITTQEQRVAFDQSVKATITNLYEKVNGYPLANDIRENGEGYFANGFMQGLTLGNHTSNSSEELESYMLGTGIEGYKGKQFVKTVGKVVGGAVSIGSCAAIGFAVSCGNPIGAVVGAGVGLLIAAGSAIFNGGKPAKVTEAY